MAQEFFPVVIIGAGPAGLAAAMQLTRQGHQPLVLERGRVGGLLWNANLVENYPGFPGGISGPELAALFQKQAKELGVRIAFEEAQLVGLEADLFRIGTEKRELAARFLVAATGTRPQQIPQNLRGPGLEEKVFSEVVPLLGSREKRVVIIGGGDAAFDYALNVAGGNQVVILNRGTKIKALSLLYDRALAHPRITYQAQAEIQSAQLDQEGDLQLKISTPEGTRDLAADYLIAAIGREPELGFTTASIMEEIEDSPIADRLYRIGDLINGQYRQTAIAVGDGLQAAMMIDQTLSEDSL